MAQPALSQAIAQLERHLGLVLFERQARGVTLTPGGQALLDKARAAIRAADEAEALARSWARADAGELVLGFLPVGLVPARSLIEEFRTRQPEVRLTLRELNFATQVRELIAGRIDAEVIAPARDIPGAVVIQIHAAPRMVMMSPQHRLATRRSLTFAEIADERQPGGHPDIPEAWLDYNWLTTERGRRPPLTDETPLTPEECIPLVARGDVITVSPDFVARSMELHGLVAVPIADVAPFTVALAIRENDSRPAVSALADIARAFAR
jgi:DNA-binding transcriptional LysR family regulator